MTHRKKNLNQIGNDKPKNTNFALVENIND